MTTGHFAHQYVFVIADWYIPVTELNVLYSNELPHIYLDIAHGIRLSVILVVVHVMEFDVRTCLAHGNVVKTYRLGYIFGVGVCPHHLRHKAPGHEQHAQHEQPPAQ